MVVVAVLPRSIRVVVMVISDLLSLLLLCGLDLAEDDIESLEALQPVLAIALDPRRDVTERFGVKSSRSPLRLSTSLDQPGPLEHAEVFRHGRLREVEWLRQRLDRRVALGEPGEDRPAGRVGQRGEGRAERVADWLHRADPTSGVGRTSPSGYITYGNYTHTISGVKPATARSGLVRSLHV